MTQSLCRVQPISCNQSHSPVYSPNVKDGHPRACSRSPNTFSSCPALSCSHSHTDSRSLSHWLPHARYLAFTHLRTLSRLIAPTHGTTLPCPHIMIVSRSHLLALSRFTLPHSVTLPFVWLSHWLSIMLCRSRHACACSARLPLALLL